MQYSSSLLKVLYNPKAFITHAAFLHLSGLQPEGLHPARGVAASGFRPLRQKIPPLLASRRSLGRVSVPMWLIILSDQLLITFVPHAALLRQAFAHCGKFPTAAPVGVWAVSQSQCG